MQEEDCEEKFKKTCYIEYEQKAYSETVQVCTTPWMKDCSEEVEEGEEFCQTVYQSECFTKQTVHEVEDDVPQVRLLTILPVYILYCVSAVPDCGGGEVCRGKGGLHDQSQVRQGGNSPLPDKVHFVQWPREVCTLEKQQVKKYTPDTSCTKIPKQLCAPQSCNIVEVVWQRYCSSSYEFIKYVVPIPRV